VVDIQTCHLQEEPTNQLRLAVKDFALSRNLSFYNIKSHQGWLRTMQLRICTTGEVMVNIVFGHEDEAARKAADQAVVKPLPETSMSAKPLTDVASVLKDPGSPLAKRSVYYDFDMYNIREEFQPSIEAHGKFLVEHKELRVRVEGNCDERGSREYNLALGQRRADAVKRALTLLGVTPKQIETVSFGSEKPKATGSNEEAWAENRRSDIVYIGIDSSQ